MHLGKKRVLVTSISKKVPLIKNIKNALSKCGPDYILVGGDIDPGCIARNFTEDFWEMPNISDLSIEVFIEMLQSRDIQFIIPTRDGELPFFAKHRNKLKQHNIHVMVSNIETILICLDKLLFSNTLIMNGFPAIRTTSDIAELPNDKFVVKERYGSGSIKIGLDLEREQASSYAKHIDSPVYQPWVRGYEISADAYIDKNNIVKGVVLRTRDNVVNGESQITTTFRHDVLERMCIAVFQILGGYGHMMLQIIIDTEGNFHIVECNSRFGGASTLSVSMGLDSFYWFVLESIGEDLVHSPFVRSLHEKRLVRHSEDYII
ncbi:MAG: carbamoyl-phosphate synthase [Paenibacillus sp.]|nr:carbamoyl-phosphate synthase [Paenibacillus sp.]